MPIARTLLLHPGYPKSGTTTLQAGLFQNTEQVHFFGKSLKDGAEHVSEAVEGFRTLVNYGTTYHLRTRAAEVLSPLKKVWDESGSDTALLSLEGLTNPFVDTHYTQPKDIYRKADDIAHILAPLRDSGVRVKILVTLRKQTELIPSLFSQIFLQGFSSGLFERSYESFLDFMLTDKTLGFGPEFQFDAFLDHCAGLFGSENIYAAGMKGVLSGSPCRDTAAMAAFLNLSEDRCIELIGTRKLNVRNRDHRRHMVARSPGVERFERNTGLSLKSRAFGLPDRVRLLRGKQIRWEVHDHSARIDEYYAASNARLADTYGIRL